MSAAPFVCVLPQHLDDELVYYKQIVSELCDKCQVFDEWFLHLQEQIARNGTRSSMVVIIHEYLYLLALVFFTLFTTGRVGKYRHSICM